jgi:hypothetical protein
MSSPQTLLDGGAASEPCSHDDTQPGMVAAVQFPFIEDDLAFQLGFPPDKIREARKTLTMGSHFIRENRRFCWSEAGLQAALCYLRAPLETPEIVKPADTAPLPKNPAPGQHGAVATFTVTNMNIPNSRLLLCRDAAGAGAKVWIHPDWRALFAVGMVIEATLGSSGDWRSRRPRSMGRF